MSKGFSGHFHGTLGTTQNISSLGESYSDRKIEIPKHIKDNLSKLKKEGSYISGKLNSFPIEDVSIMSKETGVEFAKVTIGDKEILIRGSKKGAVIPDSIIDKIKKGKGTFDFHSHPYDNDNVPSQDDYDVMASIYHATGQKTSKIVTPNGRITVYSHRGIVEIGTVSNKIDDAHKKALLKLFGGK